MLKHFSDYEYRPMFDICASGALCANYASPLATVPCPLTNLKDIDKVATVAALKYQPKINIYRFSWSLVLRCVQSNINFEKRRRALPSRDYLVTSCRDQSIFKEPIHRNCDCICTWPKMRETDVHVRYTRRTSPDPIAPIA